MPIEIIEDIKSLRLIVAAHRRQNKKIGIVPTMGALHEGHLSLVRSSISECDVTIVTIFVNPSQFGPNEDFARYPRTLEKDLDLLAGTADDKTLIVFTPTAETMYLPDYASYVDVTGVSEPFEGALRCGHFRGVATVVLKLFNISGADKAYFGQKDLQQVAVVKKLVADLNVPIEIIVCPIVREQDGLAMSSRNRYLSENQRKEAPVLFRSLNEAEKLIANGEKNVDEIITTIAKTIKTASEAEIEYIAIVNPQTFEKITDLYTFGKAAILLAVRFGKTRLLDNQIII